MSDKVIKGPILPQVFKQDTQKLKLWIKQLAFKHMPRDFARNDNISLPYRLNFVEKHAREFAAQYFTNKKRSLYAAIGFDMDLFLKEIQELEIASFGTSILLPLIETRNLPEEQAQLLAGLKATLATDEAQNKSNWNQLWNKYEQEATTTRIEEKVIIIIKKMVHEIYNQALATIKNQELAVLNKARAKRELLAFALVEKRLTPHLPPEILTDNILKFL